MAKEFEVVRDQGYGRVFCRIGFKTREAAEAEMKTWQRQGLTAREIEIGLIGGGDWFVREVAVA